MAVKRPDAIIVGAGHNSLACAVHLISKGWNVLIVEKAKIAGGAITVSYTHLTLPTIYSV